MALHIRRFNAPRSECVTTRTLGLRSKTRSSFKMRENVVEAGQLQALADAIDRIARALTGFSEEVGGSLEAISDSLVADRAAPTPASTTYHAELVCAEDVRAII